MKINFTQLSNTNHFGITLCPWYKYVSLKETRKCYKPTQLIRANNFFTHKILSSCKENKKAKSVLLKWNMTIYSLSLQSSTSSNQIVVFFEKLNFYFMKTANILVYGKLVILRCIWNICLNIDYTLICLEYICSVSSPLRRHRLSLSSCP